MLRSWFEASEHEGSLLSVFLIDLIVETGYEPAEPLQLLPPIDLEQLALSCWTVIIESELKRARDVVILSPVCNSVIRPLCSPPRAVRVRLLKSRG